MWDSADLSDLVLVPPRRRYLAAQPTALPLSTSSTARTAAASLTIIAALLETLVIERILTHLGLRRPGRQRGH